MEVSFPSIIVLLDYFLSSSAAVVVGPFSFGQNFIQDFFEMKKNNIKILSSAAFSDPRLSQVLLQLL